jgi:hypothetical protein
VRDDAEHFLTRLCQQLRDMAFLALGVVAAAHLFVETLELRRPRFGQRQRAMQRPHRCRNRRRDDDEGDDLEGFDAVDQQRAAGRKKVQIDQKER